MSRCPCSVASLDHSEEGNSDRPSSISPTLSQSTPPHCPALPAEHVQAPGLFGHRSECVKLFTVIQYIVLVVLGNYLKRNYLQVIKYTQLSRDSSLYKSTIVIDNNIYNKFSNDEGLPRH